MRHALIAALTVFTALTATASVPPPLPNPLPPLLQLPPLPQIQLPVGVGPIAPWTVEHIRSLPVSPSVSSVWIAALQNQQNALQGNLVSDSTAQPDPSASVIRRRLIARADTQPGTVLQVVYNPSVPREKEPAVVTQTFVSAPTERTLAAFMSWADGYNSVPSPHMVGNPRLYAKSTARTGADLLSALHPVTADASVSENSYSSGVAPHRMYVVGNDFNTDQRGSSVDMWYTDDGGATPLLAANAMWEEPTPQPGQHWYFDDKPAVTVSWYPATLGYVYAAAIRVDVDSNDRVANPNELMIFRSTNGVDFGLTAKFSSRGVDPVPNNPLLDNAPQCPQIVVDYQTGNVYVLWLDWSTNRIYAMRSGPDGSWFTLLPSIDAGIFLVPGTNASQLSGQSYTINAPSMINARYNGVAEGGVRYVGAVWHVKESDAPPVGVHTDIEFAALSTTTETWTSPVRVNDLSHPNTDQWNPALDYDGFTGNWLVTFYDRRDDWPYYRMYATKLTPSGVNVDGHDTAVTLTGQPKADPQLGVLTQAVGPSGPVWEVGEYHDVWNWGGRWRICHIYAPVTTNVGVYLSDVLP